MHIVSPGTLAPRSVADRLRLRAWRAFVDRPVSKSSAELLRDTAAAQLKPHLGYFRKPFFMPCFGATMSDVRVSRFWHAWLIARADDDTSGESAASLKNFGCAENLTGVPSGYHCSINIRLRVGRHGFYTWTTA